MVIIPVCISSVNMHLIWYWYLARTGTSDLYSDGSNVPFRVVAWRVPGTSPRVVARRVHGTSALSITKVLLITAEHLTISVTCLDNFFLFFCYNKMSGQ